MLDLFRLLLDFGLVVLIWLVQLVIYPSFKYYPVEAFREWHQQYTISVSYVVMPLMLGQMGVALFQLYTRPDFYAITTFVLITAAWILTFVYAVPLHAKLEETSTPLPLVEKLLRVNWLRTIFWSLSFILNLLNTFL
jgi:DMSO reductase anchor subunit